ncbi:hypothetical protein CBR_g51910 [Chara braunii]|uniref:Uncharacterized protein n=1 Tax=Chara braunii TaxID=69332 RepID=A0A388M976_CHABU|nr:hypothetical protein CBR_g51910 [Chara braunii]|eukprot:GBG91106.1 hypothetical protein CBR_g51910 [Chara braunii]
MLDCQAGLEVEPVRMGTRQGMTAAEIAEQVALITRDPIGSSAPPSADAVFERPPIPVSPLQPATTHETEELASSLPPPGVLQRSTVVRQLRLRSPSPGVLQEEGDVATTAQEAPAISTTREEVPAQGMAEEEVAAARPQEAVPMDHDGVGTDKQLVRCFITVEVDPVVRGFTRGAAMELGISAPIGGAGSEMGTHFDFDLSMGPPPTCGGATSTDRAPSRDDAADATETQTLMESTQAESPDTARDIMKRERDRLMALSNPRAQAFAWALEEARRRETKGDGVQGGVVAREDVMEGVAAEADNEAIQGGPEAVDVPVDRRPQAADEAGRQPQPVQVVVHGVPPPVITDMGSEPVVVPPRPPSPFAPQEVHCPLDADKLARDVVRDVNRLDRRIFDRRLEHPAWGPASAVWSGSTSTGGRTAGDVPGVSSGVQETVPHTGDMPPPPPRPPVGDPSSSPTGRGSRSPQTPGRSRIRDTTAVLRDVCDTSIFGRTDIDLDSTHHVTEHTARLQPGLGGVGARMTAAREVPASGCEPQRGRGRGLSADTLEHALRAATRAVQEQTPRKRGVPPRPRPVDVEGGAALGESSGVEGLGMPLGSRHQQTVGEASARVVLLRKGGGPVTIEEDDPETDAAVREEDKDYEGEEEGEEESEIGSGGDDDYGDDGPPGPPPPPPTRASRRSAAQTSSSARGRRRSASGTRGGARRGSGKGKKGR